jgi:hypothetical protein
MPTPLDFFRNLGIAFPTNRAGVKRSSNVPNSPGIPVQSGEWPPKWTQIPKKDDVGTGESTFADTLAQAIALMREQGGGGVDYDPYRASARANQAEADTALNSMYTGLAQSIAGDEAGIRQSYGDTIAAQQGLTNQAAQGINEGYRSANDMLSQQAQALGIQEGVQNQINSGQSSAGDLAQHLANNAGAGETAQTQLNRNRQSAVDYNTSVRQAAEQEGAAQRAQRVAELQSVLGQLDMREQEANAQAESGLQSGALSLAQWLYGQNTDERRYQDSLAQSAAEMAMEQMANQEGASVPGVNPQSVALIQELLGYSDPLQFQKWGQENPSGLATLLKQAR